MIEITPWTLARLALWLALSGLAYTMARYAPSWCFPLGHLAVAAIIYQKHAAWIAYEMRQPGWDGTPDMDIIFAFGVWMEIVFVCAALLPFTVLGLYLKWRHVRTASRRSEAAVAITFVN